ncbi:MAG: 4Fe-4S dicluster domain-containing protein [Planctomycetes bacterium]|nr:4Fe-4S dicluster domain-containing protein [Planctomycetota bacterium]
MKTLETEDARDGIRRRQFLEILASSFTAMSLSGCGFRPPKEKIIPYLEQPEDVLPGVAQGYASTCGCCPAACGMLVKCRDGRPIKLEGNPQHPLSHGGLCARGHAGLLDLYDSERLRGPLAHGLPSSWPLVDAEILRQLAGIREQNGPIRILSRTVTSPTLRQAIAEFSRVFPTTRHVTSDPVSSSAILEAHRRTHGERALPGYRFERAKVIVSFDADFLGTWISPVEFTRGWAQGRRLGLERSTVSWHVQCEARQSLTGGNADLRIPIRPSDLLAAVLDLGSRVARRLRFESGEKLLASGEPSAIPPETLDRIAERLVDHLGRSLVVSGSNDLDVQLAVNFINHLLNNYGNTLDLSQPSLQQEGNDEAWDALVSDMEEAKVSALILLDANPAYEHPRREAFRRGLAKVRLTLSLAPRKDETASLVGFVCPDHHFLESWGDAHPHLGVYSTAQPAVAPLFNTRAATESLLTWSGIPSTAYDFLRKYWRENLFPRQKRWEDFEAFWDNALHEGVTLIEEERLKPAAFNLQAMADLRPIRPPVAAGELELVVHPGIPLGDGRQANNPWLQELPDPITKVTWGNVASLSAASARSLGVVEGRIVEIAAGDRAVRLPVHIQPGMPPNVVAIALGYGRWAAGKIAANEPIRKMLPIERESPGGEDLYPFLGTPSVRITPTGQMAALAKTQTYDYQAPPGNGRPRPLAREATPEQAVPEAGPQPPGHSEDPAEGPALWPAHEYPGHRWAMAIDLNACTGCSACVVACQAENNIPVVGKAEIRKKRDMHWIRIDRYYSGSESNPEENPSVSFQPLLCQHCENAPCETVCPVLATLHSSEGLNMQVYNRCVGTRYCANNCPYKTRRFNWFDYAHNDLLQNLALNPDVTVRTRGIMEKCSFCAQRIAEAKARARSEGRRVVDGEVQPACVQSCPSAALVFGDIRDPRSRVARAATSGRAYALLSEVGTKPSITYLARVRDRGV